jgi:hypothetical protein
VSRPGLSADQGDDNRNHHGACTTCSEVPEVAVAIGERALKHLDQSRTRQREPDGAQQYSTPITPTEIPDQKKSEAAEEHGVDDLIQDLNQSVKKRKDLDHVGGTGQRRERGGKQRDHVKKKCGTAVSCDLVQLELFWNQGPLNEPLEGGSRYVSPSR